MLERGRWMVVTGFAVAMAWVEAATVFYLRSVVDRFEPYQPNPLPDVGRWGQAELVREVATLVMIGAVGWLAGRTWRARLGYACMAFGIWDLGYYIFLRILTGWPHSLFDWDILFLIPLPWWGPVLAPVLIALLMVAGGTLLVWFDGADQPLWPRRTSVWVGALGILLALGVFMADAAQALPGGEAAIRNTLPTRFNWPLFLCAWAFMATPTVRLAGRVLRSPSREFERDAPPPTPNP